MATGDVVLRLSEHGLAAQPASITTLPSVDEVEAARAERLQQAELRRAGESPLPDPWDAWRQQKAPEMFAPEVTHRG